MWRGILFNNDPPHSTSKHLVDHLPHHDYRHKHLSAAFGSSQKCPGVKLPIRHKQENYRRKHWKGKKERKEEWQSHELFCKNAKISRDFCHTMMCLRTLLFSKCKRQEFISIPDRIIFVRTFWTTIFGSESKKKCFEKYRD